MSVSHFERITFSFSWCKLYGPCFVYDASSTFERKCVGPLFLLTTQEHGFCGTVCLDQRFIKNGLDKHESERKSPDSDKKKHLKKETHNMLLLRKSFQLAEISFMENMFIYILNLHLRQMIVKKKRFGWKRTFPEKNIS